MKLVFFTIISKSYLPLALAQYDSLIRNNFKSRIFDYKIFIVDYEGIPELDVLKVFERIEILDAANLFQDIDIFRSLAFKYDVTEFSTAIKPFAIKSLCYDYNKVFFLDPDIVFFNEIDNIISELDEKLICLTPHVLEPILNSNIHSRIITSGVFNLGFIGIESSEKSIQFLNWWCEKCLNYCFRELSEGLFTDQKWIDFAPCFFNGNELSIIRKPGYNVAPWNQDEREVIFEKNSFFVVCKANVCVKFPLIFYHFSGFNYSNVVDSANSKFLINSKKGLNLLLLNYSNALTYYEIHKYISLPYSFNKFSNGLKISKFHRRSYRSFLDQSIFLLEDNPFTSKRLMGIVISNVQEVERANDIGLIKSFKYHGYLIGLFFKYLRILIGWKRYLLLLKYLKYFSKFENQSYQVK